MNKQAPIKFTDVAWCVAELKRGVSKTSLLLWGENPEVVRIAVDCVRFS